MRQVTLCLLIQDNRVLLAMKKRGFGAGKWNGVGGKLQEGETAEQAAIRETKEEIGVTPKSLKQVGLINFTFPQKPEWDQQMLVYCIDSWTGEPTETEEMAPQWFDTDKLPLDQMWDGDKLWLPDIIGGKLIKGDLQYSSNQKLINSKFEDLH